MYLKGNISTTKNLISINTTKIHIRKDWFFFFNSSWILLPNSLEPEACALSVEKGKQ